MIRREAGCICHGGITGSCPWGMKIEVEIPRKRYWRLLNRGLIVSICSISLSYKTSAIYGISNISLRSSLYKTHWWIARPTQSSIAIFIITTLLLLISRVFLPQWFCPSKEDAVKEDLLLDGENHSAIPTRERSGSIAKPSASIRRILLLAGGILLAGRVETFRLLSRNRSCSNVQFEAGLLGNRNIVIFLIYSIGLCTCAHSCVRLLVYPETASVRA